MVMLRSTVGSVITSRRVSAVALVAAVSCAFVVTGCGGGGDEPQPGQIGRIDGPATVDEDDAGADQDGAPAPELAPEPNVGGAITDGS